MKAEYVALTNLVNSPDWAYLENEWLAQITNIEEARDKAAQRANETAWRYWAGQEKGFKLAMTTIRRAIKAMEDDDTDLQTEAVVDKLFREIKEKQ